MGCGFVLLVPMGAVLGLLIGYGLTTVYVGIVNVSFAAWLETNFWSGPLLWGLGGAIVFTLAAYLKNMVRG